ncbi:MAG: DUF222 domain-containing protein [Sporichthyaceae bacterium]
MTDPRTLPLGLATMSPVPDVAAALAEVEPGSVCGYDTVEMLRGARRLKNAAAAAEHRWTTEVALRRPGSASTVERLRHPHEHAADEVRAGLGLSATGGDRLLAFAWATVQRLPELCEAMANGGLDEQRAWAFVEWTTVLSDEHAHAVCGQLLPRAVLDAEEQLPTGLLIKEIAKIAMALDPTWAERRYKEALRRRRVVGRPNGDGTADLSGRQLEPHRVAAACGRLDELARAAKRDGDPRRIDDLRAELFSGLLDGTYEGLSDIEISAALAATRPDGRAPEGAEPSDGAKVPVDGVKVPVDGEDVGHSADAENSAEAEDEVSEDAERTENSEGSEDAERTANAEGSRDADGSESADAAGPAAPPSPVPDGSSGSGLARRPESPQKGVQLRIRLTTLLGLDRVPAELAGWTPVHAGYGVDLAALMSAAQWRYALTDDDGHLIGSGLVYSRPRGWRRRSAHHRGVVDLLVPASLLRDLIVGPLVGIELVDPDQFRAWHPVLSELAHRMRHPKPMPDDSDRRFPGNALRRAVELDKPRCFGVGCGRAARRCEVDHNYDWGWGGRTVEGNLAPGCGRDHGLKTKGGWTMHAWEPRGYRWCTPLGRQYVVSVPQTIERLPAAGVDFWFPDRLEGPEPDADLDHEGIPWQASRTWQAPGPLPPRPIEVARTSSPPYPDDPPF